MDYIKTIENVFAEKKLNDEHVRTMTEEDEQRFKDEASEKQVIRDHFNKKRAEELRRNDQEIDDEIETGRKEVEEAVEEHKAYKETRKVQIAVLLKKCEDNREELIEELRREGLERVQEEQEKVAQGREALLQQPKDLAHEYERVVTQKKKIDDNLEKEKAVLAKEELKKIGEHLETMKDLQSAKYEKTSGTLNTLNKLTLENVACENAIGKQQSELYFTQMTNNYQLMNADQQDQTSRRSGRQCRSMITRFNDLKKAYEAEEDDLMTTFYKIQNGKRLVQKNFPDIDSITREITIFSEEILNFKLTEVADEDKTKKLLKEVSDILDALKKGLKEVNGIISNYQDSFPSDGKDQPEIVSADDIPSYGNISEIQTSINKLIKDLNEKIREFQVTDSNRLKQLQNEQFEAITAIHQKIINQSVGPASTAFLENGQSSAAEVCPKETEQASGSSSVTHQDPTWDE